MDVTMTSPNIGGATATDRDKTVSEARGRWLIANGYAMAVGGNPDDQILTNGVERSADPTLGENREGPAATDLSEDLPGAATQSLATTAVGAKIVPGDHATHLAAAARLPQPGALANS